MKNSNETTKKALKEKKKISNGKKWSVYILECKDGTFYTGITNDLEKRVKTHNAKNGAKYTKTRTPVKLVFSEIVGTKSKASKIEYKIKQLSKKDKISLIFGKYKLI